MPTAPLLVIGYGNPSRGDDAVGPLLAERLTAWLADQGNTSVEVLTDFQLSIEHALDLVDRQRVLLIDAAAQGTLPFAVTPVVAADDATYTTHAVSPGGLLETYRRITKAPAPPVELLSVPGERFELGEDLSPEVTERLEAAWGFLRTWCDTAAPPP